MCIGVPGQVVAVGEDFHQLAQVDVCGVRRDVNIALVCEESPQQLLGQWVLVHVGFAMSIIDEQEALATLAALRQMESDELAAG
ncbi:hydrogenase 2 accessory protein HypG [Kosakonia radicincitans DSM 16656]|uniref:Hydrogenase maturation factor HybG n=1 Tax=Kosakonia radicincitans TaxID=283686 RepID=A0AAX2ET97_9ENTR|nr:MULTISPECIES: hydrogenase maturation factor HybG [Kosakonia]MDP9565618.1 hydrogenase expression/formation protein HypC [Kosakonia oryzae]APG19910.1 hydrogenase 2 accessory protein HypG [Kosakonia radicincitans]ARD59070.1 hydrogenase 2 accessory protein HypG [Kosakonia radicincitans DSM 16656]KDE33868.1 hydrogenase 2 accessory protein HypG [Kosakonia radicincitans UMEnt01/12]MDD7995249.1 hydrogenase maturation factor HybG [Kosakonia radicincitans]